MHTPAGNVPTITLSDGTAIDALDQGADGRVGPDPDTYTGRPR